MNDIENVDCVIVTYNRIDLLKECLNAVRHQSYPIGYIFVNHKMKSNSAPNIVFKKDRNKLNRFYCAQRNHLYIARKYEGVKTILKIFVKQILMESVNILVHAKNRKTLRIITTIKGAAAGVFFNPEIQSVTHEK